jgi:hypothetical protein
MAKGFRARRGDDDHDGRLDALEMAVDRICDHLGLDAEDADHRGGRDRGGRRARDREVAPLRHSLEGLQRLNELNRRYYRQA